MLVVESQGAIVKEQKPPTYALQIKLQNSLHQFGHSSLCAQGDDVMEVHIWRFATGNVQELTGVRRVPISTF